MKRLLPLLVLFTLWAQSASAQIALDAVSGGAVFSTSWSHTVSGGSDRALIVGQFDDNGGSNLLTAVTWDAAGTPQSFAKIAQVQTPGDRWVSLWYLLNPASGTKTISCTTTAGAMQGYSISLTGVGALDVSGTGTGTGTATVATTLSVAANAWIISVVKEISGFGTLTITNATDARATGNGLHLAYGGPFTGSTTTTANTPSGTTNWGMVSGSFTVSGGSPPASSPTPCLMRLLGVGCEVP